MNDQITKDDILVMAATVYGESRGSSQTDREDVAQVIVNRWKHGPDWMKKGNGKYEPNTIASVCTQKYQFSCWNNGDPNLAKISKIMRAQNPLDNERYRDCLEAVLRVTSGRARNRVGSSLHYHAVWMGFPTSWGDRVEPKLDNGHHIFYEGIK